MGSLWVHWVIKASLRLKTKKQKRDRRPRFSHCFSFPGQKDTELQRILQHLSSAKIVSHSVGPSRRG